MKKIVLLGAIFTAIMSQNIVTAQDRKIDYRWNIEADSEGLWNMTTGSGAWNGMLSVDGGLSLWNGGWIEAGALASYGTGAVTDDIQGVSNIDAGENRAFRFNLLGISQQFGQWGVFAGLRNVDCDYFTSDYTSHFTGSSYGNFPILSLNHPLATFPMSAMCLHLEYAPTERIAIKWSMYNGVASDRLEQQFRIRPGDDGFFNIASATYTVPAATEEFSSATYTFIYSIAKLPDYGNVKKMHYTLLCNVEQPVVTVAGGNMQLGALLQGGWNPTKGVETCRGYAAMGAVAEWRNGSSAGVAANRVFTNVGDETDLEFTYCYPVLDFLTLTPSLHCIFTEGSDCNVVGMLRVSFAIGK